MTQNDIQRGLENAWQLLQQKQYGQARDAAGQIRLALEEQNLGAKNKTWLDAAYVEGVSLLQMGEYTGALAVLEAAGGVGREIIGEDDPATLLALGQVKTRLKDVRGARAVLERAAATREGRQSAEVLGVLAKARLEVQDLAGAMQAVQEAIRLRPQDMRWRITLGDVLFAAGRMEEACQTLNAVFGNAGVSTVHRVKAGVTLSEILIVMESLSGGDKSLFEKAAAVARDVLKLDGNSGSAWRVLMWPLIQLGRLDEAAEAAERAVALAPDDPTVVSALARLYCDEGQADKAVELYLQAAQKMGVKPGQIENLLMVQHYAASFDPDVSATWHRQYGDEFPQQTAVFENDPDPVRPLRIGLLSADLCNHVVSLFLEPMLKHHDRQQYQLYAYDLGQKRDEQAMRLRGLVDGWRECRFVSDEQVDAWIRQDRIDVLLELCGHTLDGRMGIVTRKPAPVIATYLGYPNTTGLKQVDWRITDAVADPLETPEHWFTERQLRLGRCAWCWMPTAGDPDVTPLPAKLSGYVTFATLNNFAKVNEPMLKLWGRVLNEVPGSKLILKGNAASSSRVRQRITALYENVGVSKDRLEFIGKQSRVEHAKIFSRVDVLLDPHPYSGTTTTVEALYHGLPVVTLCGRHHVSRVSASLLKHLGLESWVAATPDQYVQVAKDLAADVKRLDELRQALRPKLLASPLMDGKDMAKHMQDAYRFMWQEWCKRQNRKS